MPRVSVVIPTYNHARFIAQAVDSILAQTYPDYEVIVVDDGSTDQTQRVLASYQPRIKYLYQENGGLSAARNTGLQAAQGDYLLFLDADDLAPANKLELQVGFLEARPEFGLVYSGWQHVDESGARVLCEVRPHKQGCVLPDLLRRNFFFPVAAAVVRRTCFEQVGPFDVSLRAAEDMDMWVRIARAGFAFGYLDEVLFQYRQVKGSMSSRYANQARNEFARLDKFFADPELPEDIKALKPEAYAAMHYEYGTKYFRAGEIEPGREHIRQAIAASPALASNQDWLLNWIAGYALGPDVDEPERLLDFIFDNLPPEATTLRTLRRRARGRYHTAAIFSAYQNKHLPTARPHILPAIVGDPRILWNRGFLRLTLESLFA